MRIIVAGNAGSGRETFFSILSHLYLHDATPQKRKTSLIQVTVFNDDITYLSSVYKPAKTTYATVLFGLCKDGVKGISDKNTVAQLRDHDALVIIMDFFTGATVDELVESIQATSQEFRVQDYMVVENRLTRLNKSKRPENQQEREVLAALLKQLEDEAGSLEIAPHEIEFIQGFGLLTLKPKVFLINCSDETMDIPLELTNVNYFATNLKLEEEIASMEAEERDDFLAELGIDEPITAKVIQTISELAGLQSFYTVGEDEVRAWPIPRGSTAKEAAAKIHTDIANRFINAEVLAFEDFVTYGDFKTARSNGRVRMEKKDYPVKDRDIISFRFNK